jgi:hypothetical protein
MLHNCITKHGAKKKLKKSIFDIYHFDNLAFQKTTCLLTSAFRRIGTFSDCVFWITSGVCNDMNFNLNISLFWQLMASKLSAPVMARCIETSCHIIPNTYSNNKELPELTS